MEKMNPFVVAAAIGAIATISAAIIGQVRLHKTLGKANGNGTIVSMIEAILREQGSQKEISVGFQKRLDQHVLDDAAALNAIREQLSNAKAVEAASTAESQHQHDEQLSSIRNLENK